MLALYAFVPLFTLDQLNAFVNDFPLTVIGISNLPLAAKDVPVFALIVIVTPSLFFEIVNPVTLGNVPIVGVTDVAPLYAITFVVVVMALGMLPFCSALNV